ncbi:FtsX-like permease family protein [Streptomyces sp. NPDC048606]|uniref:ABC transporter permease n=1 Tax=Streptomyces sp. NPDC048606 TaxID=3154726 RepID=UPI0034366867
MLRTALRNLLAHKARLAMTVLAVCLGVAFVCGSLVFADSSAAAHRAATSKDFADIAVSVGPKSSPAESVEERGATALDDALVGKLAALPGVASVRPNADGSATLADADGAPLRAGNARSNLAGAYVPGADGTDDRHPLVAGRAPAGPDEIVVDEGTAAAGRLSLGDTVRLATDGPVMTKRLVGLVRSSDSRVTAGGTLVLFDRATAQGLFASPGRYTGIDLAATPGTPARELSARVSAALPADRAEAVTGAALAAQQAVLVDTLTRGYTKLPLVFAGVSLFIGSFLIVNTFTVLVTRRTREIALLRAIGASRRQVSGAVLVEAALLGLVASAAGFLLGLGVAAALPGLLSTDRDALPNGPLVIGALPVVAALAVGVGVTVLAAWLPARRAAKVAPVEAMRSAEQPPSTGRQRVRGAVGLALLALAAALLVSLSGAKDASTDNLQDAMVACGLLIAALIVLAPLLARPVIRLTGALADRVTGRAAGRSGLVGHLARENALRDPRRTAATASALMISTALVAGLAVIGESTGRALDRQAAAGLAADWVIGTRTPTHGIDADAVRRVAAVPGVRTATAVADSTLVTGGTVRRLSGVDPAVVDRVMRLDFVGGSAEGLGPGRIAVSRSLARENHLAAGDRLTARMGRDQEPRPYTVVGVYEDNPTAGDALGDASEVRRSAFRPDSAQRVLVRADGGAAGAATAAATAKRLRAAVGDNPLLKVQDRASLVREAAGSVGDLLALMYGLLALGVAVGALGIVNTLAMSVAERTREIGVLRALGMDRAGVRRMIRSEAVLVAAFGTLLGLVGGVFSAWAVGSLANGAMKGYALVLPWGTLALVCLLSLAVGAVAAFVPARRAAALDPLRAVADA